jgi:hypothetical protein
MECETIMAFSKPTEWIVRPVQGQIADEPLKVIVQVKTMGGDLLELIALQQDSVVQVKDRIAASFHIPRVRQRLIFGDVVMNDHTLIKDYCEDCACLLVVSMVVVELFDGVYGELVAQGLTKQVPAECPSEVQRKLALLASTAGVLALPEHASEWLTFMMENGIALTFFNPNDLVTNAWFNSPGLICFSLEETVPCREDSNYFGVFLEQKVIGLLDLTCEDGPLRFYSMCEDDDGWDGPASEWQLYARPCYMGQQHSYSSLSEYFMSKANEVKQQMT